jgi:hypothetical protein
LLTVSPSIWYEFSATRIQFFEAAHGDKWLRLAASGFEMLRSPMAVDRYLIIPQEHLAFPLLQRSETGEARPKTSGVCVIRQSKQKVRRRPEYNSEREPTSALIVLTG